MCVCYRAVQVVPLHTYIHPTVHRIHPIHRSTPCTTTRTQDPTCTTWFHHECMPPLHHTTATATDIHLTYQQVCLQVRHIPIYNDVLSLYTGATVPIYRCVFDIYLQVPLTWRDAFFVYCL